MMQDKLWQAEKIMEAWRNGRLYRDMSEVRREKRRVRRIKRREMEENNRVFRAMVNRKGTMEEGK